MEKPAASSTTAKPVRLGLALILILAAVVVLAVLVWQAFTSSGNPDPTAQHLTHRAVILNTAILVFREGLEAILVLAAVTASFVGANIPYRRPVAAGSGLAFLASIATWFIVVATLNAIDAPALDIQAATGLLAIVVLLIVMNWFFHRIYWTGWISHHNRRRKRLLESGEHHSRLLLGLGLLGFTAVYREGFEIVLFLQTLRLQVGSRTVLDGVLIGLALTAIVAVLTFIAHHRLPYKKMLVLTGVMLGAVLVVMVGESIQEMQLAGWVSTTTVNLPIPDWMGVWFAVFPTVESLTAQFLAAAIVLGSYFSAHYVRVARPLRRGERPAQRPQAAPTSQA